VHRGVGRVGHHHGSAITGLLASHGERGEVADAAPAHEAPTCAGGHPGGARDEFEHLCLGGHRARGFQPRLTGEVRGPDDRVHPRTRHGWRGRDEREEATAVEADVGGRGDVGEHAPRAVHAEAGIGDGPGERSGERGRVAHHTRAGAGEPVADPGDGPRLEVADGGLRAVQGHVTRG
jgi:hypothetical protein